MVPCAAEDCSAGQPRPRHSGQCETSSAGPQLPADCPRHGGRHGPGQAGARQGGDGVDICYNIRGKLEDNFFERLTSKSFFCSLLADIQILPLSIQVVLVGDSGVGKTRLVCARAYLQPVALAQLVKTHVPTIWAIDQYRIYKDVSSRTLATVHVLEKVPSEGS